MKNMIFLFLLFFLLPVTGFTANLMGMDVKEKKIIFYLSDPVTPKIFSLSNPNRIVIDFDKTRLAFNLKKYPIKNKNIASIREGHPKPQVLRIVLDTHLQYKVSSKKNSREVVLEFLTKDFSKKAIIQHKPLLIMIDPGHGGKDPGAIGDRGTKEKDVVLAIGKNLAKIINQTPGMRAILTRDGDYYVSLRERLMKARKYKVDLFIAIHADSYFDNNARGASVYSLSRRGASTVAARWLAERENHDELGGVDLGELEDQSHMLRSVLIDLAQTSTTKDSLSLGASLLGSLEKVTSLHYSRVEQAPFMVLKSPDIPSLLVETGFISNPKEEKRLRDKFHQNKIAMALFQGILSYQSKLN